MPGHPEDGRIALGGYRNPTGAVIFHIRSRARSTTALTRIGFLAIGDAMQTNTWAEFIRNAAAAITARTWRHSRKHGEGRGTAFPAVGD